MASQKMRSGLDGLFVNAVGGLHPDQNLRREVFSKNLPLNLPMVFPARFLAVGKLHARRSDRQNCATESVSGPVLDFSLKDGSSAVAPSNFYPSV